MAAKATHSTSNRRGFIQPRRGFYEQRFVQALAVAHEDLAVAVLRVELLALDQLLPYRIACGQGAAAGAGHSARFSCRKIANTSTIRVRQSVIFHPAIRQAQS